jgi:hypothetical protein
MVLDEPVVSLRFPPAQWAPQGIKLLRCNRGRAVDMNQTCWEQIEDGKSGVGQGGIYTVAPIVGLGAPVCTGIEVTASDLAAHSAVAPRVRLRVMGILRKKDKSV